MCGVRRVLADCHRGAWRCVAGCARSCLRQRHCRLWGLMGAVATLKQTAKSAADSLDTHQRSGGHQVQQQRQQTKAPAPPAGGFLPAHTAGCNAWDFHPLIGGLMDAVMTHKDGGDNECAHNFVSRLLSLRPRR